MLNRLIYFLAVVVITDGISYRYIRLYIVQPIMLVVYDIYELNLYRILVHLDGYTSC